MTTPTRSPAAPSTIGRYEILRRTRIKHPKPWHFFSTFNSVSRHDLDWFWSEWYYTTWTLDQAVQSVTANPDGSATVVVEDRGRACMPARVTITRANGEKLEREIPVVLLPIHGAQWAVDSGRLESAAVMPTPAVVAGRFFTWPQRLETAGGGNRSWECGSIVAAHIGGAFVRAR